MRDRAEYRCKCGCGLINIDEKLIEIDNQLIKIINFKPDISSACRCIEHNRSVNGNDTSSHICDKEKKCLAIDYSIPSSWRRAVITIALVELGIKRIGFGDTFLHWDIDLQKSFPVFWIY